MLLCGMDGMWTADVLGSPKTNHANKYFSWNEIGNKVLKITIWGKKYIHQYMEPMEGIKDCSQFSTPWHINNNNNLRLLLLISTTFKACVGVSLWSGPTMMVIYLLKSNFSFKPQAHNCQWCFFDVQVHRNRGTVKKTQHKHNQKPGRSLAGLLDGCMLLLLKMETEFSTSKNLLPYHLSWSNFSSY